jgi:hypothetical protein
MGRRLTIRISLLIGAVSLFVTLILAFTFRQLAFNESKEWALVIAELIRDTLTSYMVMGVIDRRDEFLSRMREVPGVESIRVVRGENVIRQFGPGSLLEAPQDDLEKRSWQREKLLNSWRKVLEMLPTR